MMMMRVLVGLMMHVALNCCHDGDGGFDADGCADHSNEDDLQCTYNERRTPK